MLFCFLSKSCYTIYRYIVIRYIDIFAGKQDKKKKLLWFLVIISFSCAGRCVAALHALLKRPVSASRYPAIVGPRAYMLSESMKGTATFTESKQLTTQPELQPPFLNLIRLGGSVSEDKRGAQWGQLMKPLYRWGLEVELLTKGVTITISSIIFQSRSPFLLNPLLLTLLVSRIACNLFSRVNSTLFWQLKLFKCSWWHDMWTGQCCKCFNVIY